MTQTAAKLTVGRISVYSLVGVVVCLFLTIVPGQHTVRAEGTAKTQTFTLGVFPYLPPREMERVFAPIAARFSEVLGINVQVRSSRSYEKFMRLLDGREFDMVFVQPFDYVRIADHLGYVPLATREEPLEALLVVNADSPYKRMQDLRGKQLAMPPEVAAVTYLARAYFKEQGIDPDKDIKIAYHRSHVSCLQKVLIGTVAACATAAPALRFFTYKMNARFNVIGKSAAIPHTLFAADPKLTELQRQSLLSEITSWSTTEDGREILARGKFTPFRAVNDQEYDVVRHLVNRLTNPTATPLVGQ